MDTYNLFKTPHLLGVVIFLGNLTITAWWKGIADRTGDPRVVAFAQRQVTGSYAHFWCMSEIEGGGTIC